MKIDLSEFYSRDNNNSITSATGNRQTIHFICIVFLLFYFSVLVVPVYAFDDSHEGFIFGGGIGPGFTALLYQPEQGEDNVSLQPYFSIQIDVRMGIGFSSQLSVCFLTMLSLTDFAMIKDSYTWFFELGDWQAIAWPLFPFLIFTGSQIFGGPEFTWYLEPQAPTWYFTGTVGLYLFFTKTLAGREDSDLPGTAGLGIRIGTGYEFAPHMSVDFTLTTLTLRIPDTPWTYVFSPAVTISRTFY